jgi:CotH kinase protein/Bacterial Ig-like domain/Lamin Tail Domain/Chitobiase/beta-hexosaminidase C-terminal domain/Fn3 associated
MLGSRRAVLAIVSCVGAVCAGLVSAPIASAAPSSPVFISELVADNSASTVHPASDWIEIFNNGAAAQDLGGWKLKDGGTTPTATWTFPSPTVLAAGGRLVVWADTTLPAIAGELHTTFGLAKGGEYLGLIRPDGTVAHEFPLPGFPGLLPNVSFGINDAGDERLFSTPTPGAPNGAGDLVPAASVVASPARGFFTALTPVTLTTATPDAVIRYTTDGSVPTAASATYTGPINVSTTTTLRSTAIKAGLANAVASTNTYIFVASVLNQGTGITGFPNGKLREFGVPGQTVPEDTAMDQAIITQYTPAVVSSALTSIPTMSLTAPVDSVFGATGLYENPVTSPDLEKPMSVELLYPNAPANNQQIDAGVEAHSHDRLKRSLRVNFRAAYGSNTFTSSLMKNAPLNGASATTKFRTLILRAGNNRAWTRGFNPDATTFTEDQLYRDTQIAVEGTGVHGTFVHLYINGVYWGLYNVAERPDENFTSAYFGGDSANWYYKKESGAQKGDAARHTKLIGDLMTRDLSVAANYTELKDYLDVKAFADYMLVNWWFGKTDWPDNNWYVGNRNAVGADAATPARYWAWDGEWALDRKQPKPEYAGSQGAWVHPDFLPGAVPLHDLSQLWKAVWANPDFRTLFYSRVATNTAPGGPLTDAKILASFDTLNASVQSAVVAESARWGDALKSFFGVTRTRDGDWQNEVNVIRTLINGNTAKLITALRAADYYPAFTAPSLDPAPGPATAPVTIANPNPSGMILYTLDGTDPITNPAALTYSAPIAITRSTTIKAVVKDGTQFTGVTTGTYTVPSLVTTEMNYNPASSSPAEVAAGFTNGDLFEYVELKNVSTSPVQLADFAFTQGIAASGLSGTVAPGEVVVFVGNPAAFAFRYGNTARVVGTYTGKLDNGGERIAATYPAGIPAFDFVYDDIAPWPIAADGTGPSLVNINPNGDPSVAANWAASTNVGGQPGVANDAVLPTVVSVSPVNGASGVAAGSAITVTFNEPVSPSGAVTLSTDGGAAVATTNSTLASSVTLTPTAPLVAGTTYRVTAPVAILDAAGNHLASEFTSTFTTFTSALPALVPLAVPGRLLDTRKPSGRTVDGIHQATGRIAAGGVYELPVAGRPGVPSSAASAVLNVTAVDPAAGGYITVYPCGTRPDASNLNFDAGSVSANAVVARFGSAGKVCIYSSADTDVLVDASAYFPSTTALVPLDAPARVLDTRSPGGSTIDSAHQQTGRVAAGTTYELPITGRAGVPTGAATAVLNVTAVNPSEGGYVTVYPCGEARPDASNLNFVAGAVIPNAVWARVGGGGRVCLYTSAETDLLVDVSGYFASATSLRSLSAPGRLLDTRSPDGRTIDGRNQATGRVAAGNVYELPVGDRAGVPAGAKTVVLNVTAVNPSAAGYITVYPCGEARPDASNLNYVEGSVVPNAVIARVGNGGKVCFYSDAETDLLVDVSGYFTL